MNKLAAKKHSSHIIGTARSGEDFEPIIRIYDRKDQLTIYYVEEINDAHVLSRYDVTKQEAKAPLSSQILDVAVSEKILVLLQTPTGMVLG